MLTTYLIITSIAIVTTIWVVKIDLNKGHNFKVLDILISLGSLIPFIQLVFIFISINHIIYNTEKLKVIGAKIEDLMEKVILKGRK